MRFAGAFFVAVFLIFLFIIPEQGAIISISKVSIDPTGYEDQSTHEWKGSFWVITATVDTTESYLLFNNSTAGMFDLNSINNETIVPSSTLKITITPRQPYWEIPLTTQPYRVYPQTYGTHFNTLTRNFPSKISDNYVPELDLTVLEPINPYQCNLYTPFDIKIEKIGNDSFTQTAHIDSVGGTDTIVVSNPSDSAEKVMIQDLGKLYTGISTPSLDDMLIINNSTAFKKSGVIDAIKYGVDGTGRRLVDDCYAFYWFGGGNYTVNDGGPCLVERWDDDHSPNHLYQKQVLGSIYTNCLVADDSFPGSYRGSDANFGLDEYAYPIAASILQDNPNTNPSPGLSLVSYLKQKFNSSFLDLNYLQQGWTITSGNKLRIYAPTASASSLITIKISSELVDSVVYQPIVGCGKCEQAYWDSSKTASCSIKDKDVAILRVKQYSPQSSKITITTSVLPSIPVSVSPLMDSAIQDPGAVHDFQFEIRNLGTQTKQNGTITFTMKNDLGTVTDTQTLEFELLPTTSTTGIPFEGDPMFIWLVAVAAIVAVTIGGYLAYSHHSAKARSKNIPPSPSKTRALSFCENS
jgi:hypothetical protein